VTYPLRPHHVQSELEYGSDEVQGAIMAAVRYFADPGQGLCYYDHNSYCQAHLLHQNPCPFGVLATHFKDFS
jgi:hypothetical protein